MFTDPYYAQVTIFAGTFAPRNWAMCNGQLMSIAQNTALFALLGTTYGGNGQTTFGLPDLRGRAAIHMGQGPGLPNYDLGETGGEEMVTLLNSQIPSHSHTIASIALGQAASSIPGTTDLPGNNYPAPVNGSGNAYSTSPSSATLAASSTTGNTAIAGGNTAFDKHPPFLVMNYIICILGIFPSRN